MGETQEEALQARTKEQQNNCRTVNSVCLIRITKQPISAAASQKRTASLSRLDEN